MNAGIIPSRYAKALLEFAKSRSAEKQVYAEKESLALSFSLEPTLRPTLDNPVLSAKDKKDLLHSAIGEKVSAESERFIDLVLENHREEYLQSIALMYQDLYRKANNISVGSLETAVAVDKEVEERIKEMVTSHTKGTMELKATVNPKLVGGFIFEIDFRRLDASVVSQLAGIRKQFIEKNRRIV